MSAYLNVETGALLRLGADFQQFVSGFLNAPAALCGATMHQKKSALLRFGPSPSL
jgi:hypothetical protein